MTMRTTPPLAVDSITHVAGSSRLTIVLETPYQPTLFLAFIFINRQVGQDVIVPGHDSTHGGKAYYYVDAPTFSDLLSRLQIPCSVVLSYDDASCDIINLQVINSVRALQTVMADALRQVLPDQEDRAAE